MTIPTREERLEAELEETRGYLKRYDAKQSELRERLEQLATLLATPLIDEQPDVAAFGRGAWVYCNQHVKPHQTGWCSISPRDKIGLGVATAKEAYAKCEAWGLKIFDYNAE